MSKDIPIKDGTLRNHLLERYPETWAMKKARKAEKKFLKLRKIKKILVFILNEVWEGKGTNKPKQ